MRKIYAMCLVTLIGLTTQAQMKDITVTLQPTATYNWFDNNTAIEDGVMLGGRLGFGFGEALELRGVYEKSIDLKNTIGDIDAFSDEFIDNFNSRDVEIERIGGEFKANIPTRGTFVPYLTFGAGVQKLNVDTTAVDISKNQLKSEQIYANVGLGTQIRLGDRWFLNLEAKNTVFNMNPANVLYQQGQDQSEVEEWIGDDSDQRMYNWSVLAGLQFYLGGRKPGEFSALDRAYYNKFSGGQSGFKLILEPSVAYINFDNKTNLADTYFLGGKVGVDLNQYVGLRGYYYQSTQDEKISTDWEDMAMYGGDFIAKLNVSRGLVPYITIGGGYLNVYDSYIGKDTISGGNSGYFAKGGLGLNVPIGRNVEIFGDANLMYTSERSSDDLENTINPDELRQHTMFNVGVRFQLGKRADDTDEIVQEKIDRRVEERTQMYQDSINALESELAKAYDENDTEKAVAIIEKKKDLERKQTGEKEQMKTTGEQRMEPSHIKMTPKELEELIEKVIKGVDEDARKPETMEERIDRLERLLLEVNTGVYREQTSPARQELASERILNKLDDLNEQIEKNADRIEMMRLAGAVQGQDKTVVIQPGQQGVTPAPQVGQPKTIIKTDAEGNTVVTTEETDTGVATGWVVNQGMSAFTGAAIADNAAMLFGIRGNYAFTNTPFKFMPELYLGLGNDTGVGVNANVVIPFDVNAGIIMQPYVGLGLGYNNVSGESAFGPNVVLGTSFNVLGGKLFADYTAHNFIDIHQISVGYKFNF